MGGGCRDGEVESGAVRAVAEPEELATLRRGGVLDRRSRGAEDEASRRIDGGDEEVLVSVGEEALTYVHGRSKRRVVEAELEIDALASRPGRELPGTPVQKHPRVLHRRFLHFRSSRRRRRRVGGWGFRGGGKVGLGKGGEAEAEKGDGGGVGCLGSLVVCDYVSLAFLSCSVFVCKSGKAGLAVSGRWLCSRYKLYQITNAALA